MKRIAIFQYEWPLQSHTLSLASGLAGQGFAVDLYLYDCDTGFVNLSRFLSGSPVNVVRLDRGKPKQVLDRIRKRIGFAAPEEPVRDSIVKRSLEAIGSAGYDYLIGVEKRGLIWAGRISAVLQVPFLYYSLELYIEGHPAFDGKSGFAALREEERLWHGRAAATIVQDAARGAVLLKSNGLDASMEVIYLPVSVSGPPVRGAGRFLHDRLSLDPSRKIILYFGSVSRNRGIDEVIRHAAGIDKGFAVVLHGPVAKDIGSEERRNDRVIFSSSFVDEGEVPALIASAHIGLSFYRNDIVNDRLTAFSSEKMALYLQSGVPVIAYANESYELLMEHYRCGELIRDMSELPAAVERIEADYERYRENALSAFERFYRCENNLRSVYAYLSGERITGAGAACAVR